MRELRFSRAGAHTKIMVATQANLRFQLWPRNRNERDLAWCASVFEITSRLGAKRKTPDMQFGSRSAAIDWLARYRQPETEETAK